MAAIRSGERPAIAVSGLWHGSQDGSSKWEVLHQQGKLHIIRQPAPEPLSVGWMERLTGLVESV